MSSPKNNLLYLEELVLQAALLVTNSLVLFQEYRQHRLTSAVGQHPDGPAQSKIAHQGLCAGGRKYLEDWWNLCDLCGIIALYVASGAHFFQVPTVLQQVGALGILLNAFSVLQLLKPFSWGQLGPLIKTVTEIMHDIKGYMIIIMILLTGFSVSFAVSMPVRKCRIVAKQRHSNRAFMTCFCTDSLWPVRTRATL